MILHTKKQTRIRHLLRFPLGMVLLVSTSTLIWSSRPSLYPDLFFPFEVNDDTAQTAVRRTKAVIFMGPHKTGTTSIQCAAEVNQDKLNEDGFYTVYRVDQKRNVSKIATPEWEKQTRGEIRERHFSSCFLPLESPEPKMYPCNPDYLLAGSTIASNKRNLFNSHEDFTSIEPEGIERLHAYLSQWDDVTIVVYYRHYFSYVGSRYNQRMKNNSIKRGHYEALQDYIASDSYGTQRYTKELVERLRVKFTDVVVVNMHDKSKGDPAESFFCHALSTFPILAPQFVRTKPNFT